MNITNLSLQGLNLKLSDNDYDSLFNDGISVVINGKIFKMEGAVSCSGFSISSDLYDEGYTMDVLHVLSDDEELTTSEDTGEDSFDKLVYIEPKSSDTSQYFSLKRSCCSEEQWNYAIKCLGNPSDCLGDNETIQWCCDDKKWFDDVGWDDDTVVFFNDIFKEVD